MAKKKLSSNSRSAQLKKKQIVLDKDFLLKRGINVFLDVLTERQSNSFLLVLWFGKEHDGSGKRIEFTDLLSGERLERANSKKLMIYIPAFLRSTDKDRFLEEAVQGAILNEVSLEIYPAHDQPNSGLVTVELTAKKIRYFSSLDLRFSEFSEVLIKTDPV